MLVTGMTLGTTYVIQVQDPDGEWHFYSQGEYDTEAAAATFARSIYGGRVPTRIVKIERTVAVGAPHDHHRD